MYILCTCDHQLRPMTAQFCVQNWYPHRTSPASFCGKAMQVSPIYVKKLERHRKFYTSNKFYIYFLQFCITSPCIALHCVTWHTVQTNIKTNMTYKHTSLQRTYPCRCTQYVALHCIAWCYKTLRTIHCIASHDLAYIHACTCTKLRWQQRKSRK